MIGLVVATHGDLAESLLATAAMIIGPVAGARAISLSRDHSPEELGELLDRAIGEVDGGDGVLVAADMFGGTPANVGMTRLVPGRVDLLTGVNLPMLLKFLSYREHCPLPELAEMLRGHARDSIVLASEVLGRHH